MSDINDGRSISRRGLMSALGGAAGGVASIASGGALSGDGGDLVGGSADLTEAFRVSDGLWIGPDSAKDTVAANSGRLYKATDTQVEYVADSGSWNLQGIGSSTQPVPSVTAEEGQWIRSEPSSGTNTWTSLVNSTSGDTWSWALKSNGYMSLLSGTSEVLEVDNSGAVDSQSPINIEADLRVWDLIEWGSSAEITSRYSSGNDAWELLDSINIRLRVDRSTGDLSVEGTVTEGANL